MALPLDVALERAQSEGVVVRITPYGPPRARFEAIADPAKWRVAQVIQGPSEIELIAVPGDPGLLPPDPRRKADK